MIKNNELGFTLVELMIVFALIALLSVAMLALINPVDKVNRANDAAREVDAVDILHAYQSYAIYYQSFPWMDVDNRATVGTMNTAWFGRSDETGFGLCALAGWPPPASRCTDYQANPGLMITRNELKTFILSKGYTSVKAGDPKYDGRDMDYLWVDKKWATSAQLDVVYVCYIPKADSDRRKKDDLKKPLKDASGNVIGLTETVESDFLGDKPAAGWNFVYPSTSLFKCVP